MKMTSAEYCVLWTIKEPIFTEDTFMECYDTMDKASKEINKLRNDPEVVDIWLVRKTTIMQSIHLSDHNARSPIVDAIKYMEKMQVADIYELVDYLVGLGYDEETAKETAVYVSYRLGLGTDFWILVLRPEERLRTYLWALQDFIDSENKILAEEGENDA